MMLTDLVFLYRAAAPFVTVYLDTSGTVADAPPPVRLRWKSLRRELAAAGAPEAALAAIDPLVDEADPTGDTLAVIANRDGVLLGAHLPDAPMRDLGRCGMLPAVVPLLAWRQRQFPYVVVATDRPGLLARIAGSLALGGLNILSALLLTALLGLQFGLVAVPVHPLGLRAVGVLGGGHRGCLQRREVAREAMVVVDAGERLEDDAGAVVSVVGSNLAQGVGQLGRLRAKIFLIENSILIDNERHHTRVRVFRGVGQECKSASHLAVHQIILGAAGRVFSLPHQDPEVITVKRARE